MGLLRPRGHVDLAHTVDDVETEIFELFIIKVVYIVQFLKEDDRCLTFTDFLDYARPTEGKAEHISGLDIVSIIWRGEVVSQDVVTHHMDGLLDCAATRARV